MRLRGFFITGSIVLVPATLLALGIGRDNNLSAAFERVSIGMSRAEAANVMGIFGWTEGCGSNPVFKPDLDRCAEMDVYPSSFAPLNPEYWVIYFDGDQRVIGKFDFQSP